MNLPSNLNGNDLVKAVCRTFGYEIANQTGSHIKLKQNNKKPITIPAHKPLKKGTLKSILTQLSLYEQIEVEELIKKLGI